MPLYKRSAVVLAKIETTYGTDPTPTGTANAILVSEVTVTPVASNLVARDLVRPYFGNSPELPDACYATVDLTVELAGAGGAGTTPAYDPLLRACAFAATASTHSLTSITRSGAVATATRIGHGFIVGDSVVISGAAEPEYNGTFTVATVPTADTFTYAVTGAPATPATGTLLIGNQVVYTPVSSGLEGVTVYVNISGKLHMISGCRGTVSFDASAKSIPKMMFKLTGLYQAASDAAAPTPTYTGFMQPSVVNRVNTPTIDLHGYSSVMSQFSVDIANNVVFRSLPGGSEQVLITDRKATAQMTVESVLVASKDWQALIKSAATGALTLTHGTARGHQVTLASPAAQIKSHSYQDMDGILMDQFAINLVPGTGNDEFTLAVR